MNRLEACLLDASIALFMAAGLFPWILLATQVRP